MWVLAFCPLKDKSLPDAISGFKDLSVCFWHSLCTSPLQTFNSTPSTALHCPQLNSTHGKVVFMLCLLSSSPQSGDFQVCQLWAIMQLWLDVGTDINLGLVLLSRQIVARGLLDVLREFSDNENDFISVMETVARMSEDGEPTVRAELMEQVPNIAMFLHESQPNFPAAFSRYLVPIVVRYLTDPNNQVRKTSQAALLVLLEQGLICKGDMETKVCPVLLDLTEPSSDDDYKIEAVAIMCKLVTMLSKDTVEHLLLLRFCELCSDARLFQVRKVCAANFGEFCSIVGQDATEKLLMSKFFDLCSDSLWGIRKACAECFMIVSNSTSPGVRRTKLSPLFISLISDQSRWVRQAAFQSLGRFISTFANPSSTGLYFKEDGTLLEVPRCPFDRLGLGKIKGALWLALCCRDSPLSIESSMRCSFNGPTERPSHPPINQDGRSTPTLECMSGGDRRSDSTHTPPRGRHEVQERNNNPPTNNEETEQTDENFNSFHYWRPPLPDISEELEMLKDQVPLQNQTMPHMDDPDAQAQVQVLSAALKAAQQERQSEDTEGQSESQPPEDGNGEPDEEFSQNGGTAEEEQTPNQPPQQTTDSNVIPQQLLDQYLSMTDPARAQTVDTEIAKHCAFSLPGVALTLGQQNWHCLKDTYETLATDVQWKVRRTLAFSIHELAVILGDQLTAADLVPIFNGFLKDLDEVRIGVLKHLYDFLKLLHAEKRREYLYQLQEFMVTDNSRNWRFRYELAEQLILIIELYSHYDVYDYLRQIALTLCSDKVSEVRWISYKLVVEILQKMYACGAHDLGLNFINELIVRFCHCPKWVGRQAFAFICQAIVEEDCMPMDQFAQHLLPSLLSLSSDPVANVRVLVAKALRQSVMEKEPGSAYSDELEETVMALQADKDRDVRFFASQDSNMALMDTAALI
uniref:Phosphatase 2A Regulatory Subunit A helical domain-containing protein n=1 Tax=Oncorhynchus tshawytscha TaxID=74940 RepID=A0A8C8HHA7_ONCTS